MALPENPGLAASGGVHIGLLALALLSFSWAPQLRETEETIPVAIVTNDQLNQILKGEKTAAEVKPLQRSEKLAQVNELSPQPSAADAPKDVPAPPSPLKRQPEQSLAAENEPRPAQPAAATLPHVATGAAEPAPRPAAFKRPPQHLEKPLAHDDAEKAAALPAPPKPPAETSKKAGPKFRLDQVARLLDQGKQKEKQNPGAKPKSGDEAQEPRRKFDLSDIEKLLSKEEPQRKQSTGHELSKVASLGSPTASAPKMSPSLWSQLDGLLQEQYKRCWNFAGLAGQQRYIPEIHVQYTPEGALSGEPQLLNPPSDPNLRALAESAMRAVRRCDPLQIPAQYQQYYDQWKGRIVRFDPEEML
jgi:colicin import membrane protein